MSNPPSIPREQTESVPAGEGTSPPRNGPRTVALLVLIPTVPMLLLSVAALVVYYLAPERFTAFLDRLPGTGFLRLALIFSPVTLFGVVLLAVLYALEPGRPGAAEEAAPAAPGRPAVLRLAASIGLAFGVPLLLASAGALVLSFAAPGRFGLLIEKVPGTSYLRATLPFLPFLSLLISAVSGTYLVSARRQGAPRGTELVRWSVRLILLAAIPLLLATAGGLALFYTHPEVAEKLVSRLGVMAFVKLGLIFAPAILLALIVLAGLYLARTGAASGQTAPHRLGRGPDWRSWVLVSVLGASSVTALGLLLTVIYLLVR